MPRSLKVDQDYIGTVKAAVRRNGFHSQRELAEALKLALATVNNFLNGKPVDRAIFEEICASLALDWKALATPSFDTPAPAFVPASNRQLLISNQVSSQVSSQDWGDAPDASVFYGRTQELQTLQQWIVQDRCRLIAVLGMGGIGKTDLTVRLAQALQGEFEYVTWRSVLNAPPLKEVLTDWIKFLSNQQETQLPENLEGQLTRLRHYLQSHRCLLILDNVETILMGETYTGQCREGYEAYGQLLDRIGKVAHQSCLLITSREKPKQIVQLESNTRPVRSLELSGLGLLEGKQIFAELGDFTGIDPDWQELVQLYNGNPLGLKLAAKHIGQVFAGSVHRFLGEGKPIFHDLLELLDCHFQRLSGYEQEIVYWLAINREPVSIAELKEDILDPVAREHIPDSLQSLQRRWTLERVGDRFTLQPVLMEYVTSQINAQITAEIQTGNRFLFGRYALLKAVTKEYIREAQRRLILHPIAEKTIAYLGGQSQLERQLKHILDDLRSQPGAAAGYAAGNLLNLLCHLQADLRGYDWSHLTLWQAHLQGAILQEVNFAYAHFARSVFTQTFGGVLSIGFSPDGKTMATGNANGNLYLWRVEDGQHLLTCQGHTNWCRRVVFSPDGQMLASASEDQTIKLWNLQDGSCLRTIRGQSFNLRSVAFSPNSQMLVSTSDDQMVRIWDVQTGACLRVLAGHQQWALSAVFSPDGKRIASSSCDQTIRIWDVESGTCLKLLAGHQSWVVPVAFSPDGKHIASGSLDQSVRIWDVQSGECLRVLQEHTGWVWSVAFSPNGEKIASTGVDQTIRIWQTQTGKCLHAIQEHTKQVWAVSFHPDGQRLASCGDDQTIRVWSVQEGRCLSVVKGHTNWVRSVTFGADEQTLISANKDHTVRIWHTRTCQCLHTLKGHLDAVMAVAYDRTYHRLASASDDQTIRIWDVSDQTCRYTLKGHTRPVWAVAFSPDGQTLVSAGCDNTVRIWDVQDGICLHTLRGHGDRIGSVAFSPDGALVASASEDQTIKVWDVATGQCCHTLQGHSNRVLTVAFSPTGQYLASGSLDETIKLWDVQTGECCQSWQEHKGWILSIAFSPDGQTLASSSCDQTVKIWRVDDGQCLNTLKGHSNWVWSVCFSPDGASLSSAGEDEIIRIWSSSGGSHLATLQTEKPYEGMNITGTSGLTQAQKITLKALGAVESEDRALEHELKLNVSYASALAGVQDSTN